MPVVAVAAAAGSIAAGAAAVTAGSAIVGGMMIAGGAMTAIGTVTGNKKLAAFGGLLGLAGGVANMAGWGKAAGDVASASAIPTDGFAGGAMSAADADALSGLAGTEFAQGAASTGATEAALSASNLDTAGVATGASDIGQGPWGGTESQGVIGRNIDTPAGDATAAGTSSGNTVKLESTPTTNAAQERVRQAELAAQKAGQGSASTSGVSDTFQRIGKWITDNKEVAKVGGGLISGAMKNYSDQQVLDRQAAERQKYVDRYNASITGQRK